MDLSKKILSDLTVYMKYAKYKPELSRRETWEELVTRNMNMHIKKFPHMKEEIEDVYKFVFEKKILPSMRSLQFGGKPIEVSPNRSYNCSYLPIEHIDSFSEIMFLLLGGCFHEDTEIKTKEGDKKIKDITRNDFVMTYDTENDEFCWINPFLVLPTMTENEEKIELIMEDGLVVKCTSNHKFFTENRGWVEAKDLTEDDDIKTLSDQVINLDYKVSDEEIFLEYKPIYDFLLGN